MKRLALLGLLCLVFITAASAGGPPKLSTFGNGHVFAANGECAFFVGSGEYGGCYRKHTSNKSLSAVNLSFTSRADVGGGAPRFSIPVDEDQDAKTTEGYAFMDVNGCGGNLVATNNPACTVYYKAEVHANWAAFVAAHPTWRLARKDSGQGTEPF